PDRSLSLPPRFRPLLLVMIGAIGTTRRGRCRRRRSRRRPRHLIALDAKMLEHLALHLGHHFRVLPEEGLGIFAALANPLALPREPRPALLENVVLGREVQHVALAADAFAVHDVELDLAERWRQLVLDDFDARAIANHLFAIFQGDHAPDAPAHAPVDLERVAAGRGL